MGLAWFMNCTPRLCSDGSTRRELWGVQGFSKRSLSAELHSACAADHKRTLGAANWAMPMPICEFDATMPTMCHHRLLTMRLLLAQVIFWTIWILDQQAEPCDQPTRRRLCLICFMTLHQSIHPIHAFRPARWRSYSYIRLGLLAF